MLNIFSLVNGRLVQEEIESLDELARFKPIWVDLESPTREEKRWVAQHYGLSIPEDAMDDDIEESARFYEEDNGELHIRSDFLIDDDDDPRSVRFYFNSPGRVQGNGVVVEQVRVAAQFAIQGQVMVLAVSREVPEGEATPEVYAAVADELNRFMDRLLALNPR